MFLFLKWFSIGFRSHLNSDLMSPSMDERNHQNTTSMFFLKLLSATPFLAITIKSMSFDFYVVLLKRFSTGGADLIFFEA